VRPSLYISLMFSNANFGMEKLSYFLELVMEEAVTRYNGKGWNSLGN
jgi:hypothetical protein